MENVPGEREALLGGRGGDVASTIALLSVMDEEEEEEKEEEEEGEEEKEEKEEEEEEEEDGEEGEDVDNGVIRKVERDAVEFIEPRVEKSAEWKESLSDVDGRRIIGLVE